MQSGLVVKNTGSWYYVRCGEDTLMCKIKGKFRLKEIETTNPIAVGDMVDFDTDGKGASVITEIHPRKNYIIRKSSNLSHQAHIIAANIDMAFLVVTLNHPVTSTEFIDRFLVTSEAYKVPITIVINKIDLHSEDTQEFKKIYTTAGYRVIEASSVTGQNIDLLRDEIKNRITLFSGNSGVGKSTLINTLEPSLELRTGEISSYHNRGKHTTTFSEMFSLPEGGFLVDTPGIKGFGLIDFEKDEICRYFPEMFRFASECQYYNCTHTHEPDCAIKDAVALGYISESRYVSYLKLLEDNQAKYRK